MPRSLFPREARAVYDWYRTPISKHALDKLQPGCIVRCIIDTNSSNWEALYFEIVKIKDGTFWGKTLNTYRMDDYVGLPTDTIFTFRKNHIVEIPITWQPKYMRKILSKYIVQ